MGTAIYTPTKFACGDWVKITSAPGLFGRIVELRGPLGPNGCEIYRVRLKTTSPKPIYVEFREGQLEKAEKPEN